MEISKKPKTLNSLHGTAARVVENLRAIERYKNSRILVIGGLAVKRYLPNARVSDVDFLIETESSAPELKLKFLEDEPADATEPSETEHLDGEDPAGASLGEKSHKEKPKKVRPVLMQPCECLFYKESAKVFTQVDLIPARFCRFIPPEAQKVRHIGNDNIPYISKINLIVFKVWCCGLRSTHSKKKRDVEHAKALLRATDRPISLSSEQIDAVEEGPPDLFRLEEFDTERWWRNSLGLPMRVGKESTGLSCCALGD